MSYNCDFTPFQFMKITISTRKKRNWVGKHNITEEMVRPLINMLESEDKDDVLMAADILKNSNVNENYHEIINRVNKKKWKLFKGKVQKKIVRDMSVRPVILLGSGFEDKMEVL